MGRTMIRELNMTDVTVVACTTPLAHSDTTLNFEPPA